MRKRRIVATAMAGMMCVATVGSLASCTGGSVGGTIHVAYAETGYGKDFMLEWKRVFEEKTGAYVYLEGSPTMTAEVETRLQTNSNLPDIFIVLDTGWQKQAASGRLEALDDVYYSPKIYMDDTCEETIMDFMNEDMRDYGKLLDGHYYAIPWTDGPTGIIYNKTMFDQYGWNQSPETVEDLMELCDQILADTNRSVKPFAINSAYGGYIVDTWWAQYEGPTNFRKFFSYVDDDFDPEAPDYENHLTTVGYLQQGRVEALRAFENLFYDRENYDKKNMTYGVSDHTTAHKHFGLKQSAMIVEGAWIQNEAKSSLTDDNGNNKFEYAMMKTPFLDAAAEVGGSPKTMVSMAGDFMCIPKRANNVAGAKEFLKFINSVEGCEIWSRSTGGAMRPYQYKVSEVEGVEASDFMKSCWKVFEESDIVYQYSTNPLQWSNKVGKWPGLGVPYEGILTGEYIQWENEDDGIEKTDENGNLIPQAVVVCDKIYDYIDDNWWTFWEMVQ